MMQSEKPKLMSCFGNDYCIATTLFITISKINNKSIFMIFTKKGFWNLWSCFFLTVSFERKKVWHNPLCFIIALGHTFRGLVARIIVIKLEYNPRGTRGPCNSHLSLYLFVCLVLSILLSYVSYIHTHYLSFMQS